MNKTEKLSTEEQQSTLIVIEPFPTFALLWYVIRCLIFCFELKKGNLFRVFYHIQHWNISETILSLTWKCWK